MAIARALKVVALAAGISGLQGCGLFSQNHDLCTDGGIGTADHELAQVFKGAAEKHPVCRVPGSDLEEDEEYKFSNGLLIIDGDVPKDTEIKVISGKVYVTGDVKEDAELRAGFPAIYKDRLQETLEFHGGEPRPGRSILIPVFQKFKHPEDPDPAVMIDGLVEDDAIVSGNKGIHVTGGAHEDAALISHYGKVTTGKPEQAFYIAPLVNPNP